MRTERVTFLTTQAQKTALDAFAAKRGESVGNVVREATARYIAEADDGDELVLEALTRELAEAVPGMQANIEAMLNDVVEARRAVANALDRSSNPR